MELTPLDPDRRNSLVLGLAVLSLQDFARRLIAKSRTGTPLDDETITDIRRKAILSLKNSHATGLSLEMEADILRQAIETFDKMIDGATPERG